MCDDDEPRCKYGSLVLAAESRHIQAKFDCVLACRHQLSLYAHISHIAWDTKDPDCVAGVVSDLASNRLQPFRLDTRSLSHFEVVQQVWAAVG